MSKMTLIKHKNLLISGRIAQILLQQAALAKINANLGSYCDETRVVVKKRFIRIENHKSSVASCAFVVCLLLNFSYYFN